MICVIFGGAEISDYSSISVPGDAFVIAADSGYRHCLKLGIRPHMIVGDFDSWSDKLPRDCRIITAPCEKDDTDLMLAVKTAFDENINVFHIYGADGGRMGHTYAAIQTLAYILSRGGEGYIFGNGFVMTAASEGEISLECCDYKYISLFSLTDRSQLYAEGLKYGGEITLRSDFPLGVSNQFTGDSAKINVKSGKILIISEK